VTSDRIQLRATFDAISDLYDRVRPGYPAALLDDLATAAGLGPGSRVLEIGPGTGQLTVPLAERGYRVVAVELGADLAAAARRNLRRCPGAEVVTADFDRWPLPAEPFDLVIAATAFHWLDPDTRMDRTADALRPGGTLAVIGTHHIAGGTPGFFAEVQDCYLRFDPETTPPGLTLQPAAEITADDAEAARSGRFIRTDVRGYEWEQAYTTAEYLDVLRTYSSTLILPATTADGLLGCIGSLIDRGYGGRIAKRYLTQLMLAERA
jgi:SAM-dependent methyltransferase